MTAVEQNKTAASWVTRLAYRHTLDMATRFLAKRLTNSKPSLKLKLFSYKNKKRVSYQKEDTLPVCN